MQKPGLVLVLGGKNLEKTFLKGEAIKRCSESERNIDIISPDMRDADMLGKPLITALDLQRPKISAVENPGNGTLACSDRAYCHHLCRRETCSCRRLAVAGVCWML